MSKNGKYRSDLGESPRWLDELALRDGRILHLRILEEGRPERF